jgi:hypothetical protein
VIERAAMTVTVKPAAALRHCRTLMARAATTMVTRAIALSSSINSFARRVSGTVSVGLNAVAVQ